MVYIVYGIPVLQSSGKCGRLISRVKLTEWKGGGIELIAHRAIWTKELTFYCKRRARISYGFDRIVLTFSFLILYS
jgi:hypothetical protein